MTGSRNTIIKFGIFAVIMVVLTALLFATFAQVRTGSTSGYSAIFKDASRLVKGDTVRVAGIRVGTVRDVQLLADRQVQVDFDADKSIVLTTGTKAAIRYLNLVGDRYLELVDSPGSTRILSAGSQIPVDRTSPALDLDMLLGGLKPVLQGLNPQDVNALTSALVEIFQGQGDTLQSLMTRTSSFSSALADTNQVIEQLIDNLRTVVGTYGGQGVSLWVTIEVVRQIATEIQVRGGVARPRLGVAFDDVSPLVALDRGRSYADGALINKVAPGSVAARAVRCIESPAVTPCS